MNFQSHLPYLPYLQGKELMKAEYHSIDKLLAECLVKAGLIADEELQSAKKQQHINGKYLEEIIIEQGWIKPETVLYLKENLICSSLENNKLEPVEILKINDLGINLSAKRVFRIILAIISFLVSANLIVNLSQRYLPDFFLRDFLATQFNLDGELNIPAVYSALTLLFCSIILSVITSIKKNKNDCYTAYWRRLSIIFAFLFFDELASLHEKMALPVRAALNTKGFLYFAWVIPGIIIVLLFLLIFLRFIINLPQKTRNHFVIAGTLYVSGAIGCELLGGYLFDAYTQQQSLVYLFVMTLEESLEMLGIAVFIYGLLSHISYSNQDTVLKILIPGKKGRLFT
jgi:hypothetical protein